MRSGVKVALGSAVAASVAAVVLLVPLVPLSLQFACMGPPQLCPSVAAYGSISFAAAGTGAVYVSDISFPSASHYCLMDATPMSRFYSSVSSVCGYLLQ